MKILVANLGSTSLKYRLFSFGTEGEAKVLHRGGIERVTDYSAAIQDCLADLKSSGAIQDSSEISAVGFKTIMARGVNGCVRLDDPVLQAMEVCNRIAPAHNPPYLTGIRLFSDIMPETPMIGLFETAFYQWAPEPAMTYAVPETWRKAGVRRWGFHGASHKYIAERSAQWFGREDVVARVQNLYVDQGTSPVEGPEFRVVSCHLGGSSSITGIRSGLAIGNSLGMSPQSGLPHNNRVGDLDSFAIPFMMREQGLDIDEVEKVLCQESGLKGLSGGLNDLRDIQNRVEQRDSEAKLALDVLVHQTRHWIGAFHWELDGLDALVFTAGIGENQPSIRAAICQNLERIGVHLDPSMNEKIKGEDACISTDDSPIKVLVLPTNEELVVAREVHRFLNN